MTIVLAIALVAAPVVAAQTAPSTMAPRAGGLGSLGKLTGQEGVVASPDYAAGQQGTLGTGQSALSLDTLKGQVKTRVCGLVLSRARSFL